MKLLRPHPLPEKARREMSKGASYQKRRGMAGAFMHNERGPEGYQHRVHYAPDITEAERIAIAMSKPRSDPRKPPAVTLPRFSWDQKP